MTAPAGRVTMVSHSREVGGAELHLERLAIYLAGRLQPAYQLELLCRPDPVLDAWVERIAAAGVVIHRLGLSGPGDLVRMVRLLFRSRLVHLHIAYPVGKYQWSAALITRLGRRPLLATHHLALDIRALQLEPRRRRAWFLLFRVMVSFVNRHIAVSRYAKAILAGVYHVDPERMAVVYVGTDPNRFAPAAPQERSRLRASLLAGIGISSSESDAALVCSVARLSPQKGLLDLIEAARVLKPEHPLTRYLIIGEGEMRPLLLSAVRDAGLESTVLLAGNLPPSEVARWLQAADLFVLASHFEGGPATALVEAMATGCAVIATRVSGSDELVIGTDYGWLVEARHPDALAGAISRLLADPALRERLGRQARARVIADFDIERCHRETLDIYRSMLTAS